MVKKIISLWGACFIMILGCSKPVLESSLKPHPLNKDIAQENANSIGYFLPKGMIRLTFDQSTNSIKVETRFIPDPNYFYTLSYLSDPASYDKVTVGISEKTGMLEKVDVNVTDQRVAIIQKLLAISKEVAKLFTFPAPGAFPALQKLRVDIDPDIFIFKDRDSLDRREKFLNDLNTKYGIEKFNLKCQGAGDDQVHLVTQGPSFQQGVYYRPLISYDLTFAYKAQPDPQADPVTITKMQTIELPNGAPILSIDVTRAALAGKTVNLVFSDGLLTSIYIKKDSEALKAINIPLEVVKTIVSLPTDLISFRIGLLRKRADLLDAQRLELEALMNLMQEKKDLEGAKKKKDG